MNSRLSNYQILFNNVRKNLSVNILLQDDFIANYKNFDKCFEPLIEKTPNNLIIQRIIKSYQKAKKD